ncbi:MAG TPA: hypothetical protein [Caudoviricetes sp.]|nr:MAG TPA: hypothetical protein [Caudoviricetes sp.]
MLMVQLMWIKLDHFMVAMEHSMKMVELISKLLIRLMFNTIPVIFLRLVSNLKLIQTKKCLVA